MPRFVKFCVVGFSGVIVDMSFFWLLSGVLGWPLAKAIGTEAAIVNNFLWNDLWTFADLAPAEGRLRRFVSFNLICGAGLVISLGLLALQIGRFGVDKYVANAVAILAVTAWNFGVNRAVSWRDGRLPGPGRHGLRRVRSSATFVQARVRAQEE